MTNLIQLPRKCYLILVQPPLVSMDIALTLADYSPGAKIITARTAREAQQAVSCQHSLVAAFLGMGPMAYANGDLAPVIRALGAEVILIGEDAEDAGPGPEWSVLERPFTSDGVIAALERWGTRLPSVPLERPPVRLSGHDSDRYSPTASVA